MKNSFMIYLFLMYFILVQYKSFQIFFHIFNFFICIGLYKKSKNILNLF